MKYKLLIFLVFSIFPVVSNAQQWDNPENTMLSNTMNDFFYYATKDPVPFSDPNSLRVIEQHARISDNYHEETERISEMVRQQRLLQQIQMHRRYGYYGPYRYNPYGYYNRGPGFIIP